jgi:hypothetical protein
MDSNQPKAPKRGRVQVQLPGNLNPTYANFAIITHSASEIVMDFAQVMPQLKQAKVQSRIIMTAFNGKLLLRALQDQIDRYEAQFGEIKLPEGTSLADQLFRSPTPDEAEDDE